MQANRSPALDALKWLAMLTMVLDHLRYLGDGLDALYIPGRLAFPWFCLAIAAHQARRPVGAPPPWRQLGWLTVFAVLSEAPYRLYVVPAETLNVMPTLAAGLLIANAVRQRSRLAMLLGALALAGAAWWADELMFGLPGALLPAAMLLVWDRSLAWQLLPGLVCLLGNVWRELFEQALAGYWVAAGGIVACLLAPALGRGLLRQDGHCHGRALRVPPLGRWAYGFYPAHFAVLWAMS